MEPIKYKMKSCLDCGNEFIPAGTTTKRCKKCQKAHRKAYRKAYRQSPEYKAYQKAYQQSPKGKAYQKKRYLNCTLLPLRLMAFAQTMEAAQ